MENANRMLIADDDSVQLKAMARLLQRAGYEILTAQNGAECLRLAAEKPVDLILLDVVLPDINGLAVCRQIKQSPRISETYVVLLSAVKNLSDDQAAGLESGADGYLARPIPNRELLARVESLLRLKAAEDQLRAYADELEARVAERTQDLEAAHQRLLRQERLAALGQLSGSIAHELRGPIGALKNAVYLLNLLLEAPDTEVQSVLSILRQEIATSERIINNLLDFARLRQPDRRPIDVVDSLRSAQARLTIPENIHVQNVMAKPLPIIEADERLLELVWSNLMLNAIQAMPDGGGLTVTAAPMQQGGVSVSITDTGVGISGTDQAHLFEPLFTTRVQGIGLGLPLAKMLVEAHHGAIHVHSTAGEGSTFVVDLPTPNDAEDAQGCGHSKEKTL